MRAAPHRSDGYRELRPPSRPLFLGDYSTTAGWAIASPGQAAIRHSSDRLECQAGAAPRRLQRVEHQAGHGHRPDAPAPA